MKNRKRVPKRSSVNVEQKPVRASEVPADRKLSNVESIGALENELGDDFDREENSAERDYEGRSTDEEDGAVPAEAADRISMPQDAVRSPNRPPRHNI